MKIFVPGLLLIVQLAASPLTNAAKLVFPTETLPLDQWTTAEKQKPIAVRHLHKTDTSSTHLVRLAGAEKPHVHDSHDLTVTVLSGTSTIHIGEREEAVSAGDVIVIPKGTYHWAENNGEAASIVLTIFSPAFDGKDVRNIAP